MSQAVQILTALAQAHRLTIYRLLVQAGPPGKVAGEIASALGLPAATLSFHLKTLTHAGLVQPHAEGRHVRYTADFAVMHALIDYLSENCCGSTRATCAPGTAQAIAFENRSPSR